MEASFKGSLEGGKPGPDVSTNQMKAVKAVEEINKFIEISS